MFQQLLRCCLYLGIQTAPGIPLSGKRILQLPQDLLRLGLFRFQLPAQGDMLLRFRQLRIQPGLLVLEQALLLL